MHQSLWSSFFFALSILIHAMIDLVFTKERGEKERSEIHFVRKPGHVIRVSLLFSLPFFLYPGTLVGLYPACNFSMHLCLSDRGDGGGRGKYRIRRSYELVLSNAWPKITAHESAMKVITHRIFIKTCIRDFIQTFFSCNH